MKNLFKINTATGHAVSIKLSVVKQIKQRCGLTDDAWAAILFNTGCQFVELHIASRPIADALLMNKEYGFWDWWFTYYTQHDETLLDYAEVKNIDKYARYKQDLLRLWESNNQFTHFLNANRRLNGVAI